MITLSLLYRKLSHTKYLAEYSGLFITLLVIGGIELLNNLLFPIRYPALLYMPAIIYATYLGGIHSGLISILPVILYSLFRFSALDGPFSYSEESITHLLLQAISLPLCVVLMGILKQRAEQSVEIAKTNSILTDILHERTKVEQALRRSESRFRRIYESNIIGIFFWDMSGKITEANDAFLAMVGYSRDDLLAGRIQWSTLTPPEYHSEDGRIIEELVATGLYGPLMKEYIRKDGNRVALFIGASELTGTKKEGVCYVVDITESRNSYGALQASEERLRRLSEAAFEGIAIHDHEKIIDTNQTINTMLGYSPAELIGQSGLVFIAPECREEVVKNTRQDKQRYETVAIRKDGSRLPVEVSVKSSEIAGLPMRVVAVRDITERKRIEEALRRSEALWHSLVQNSSDMLTLIDSEGTILFISSSVTRILGYTAEDLIGANIYLYADPEYRIAMVDLVQRVIRDKQHPVNDWCPVQHASGEWRIVEITVTNMLDNSIIGAIVINSRDVTERMRAAEELEEARRALATLISNLPGMAYRCRDDSDWTFEFVSEGCLELTGYTPEELTGSKLTFKALTHPHDQPNISNQINEAIRQRSSFQLVYRIITADGSIKWVAEYGSAVFSKKGSLIALEGFVTDATERMLAYHRLEQRVEERTREIERRRRVAEGLRDILTILNSHHPLDEMLDTILSHANHLIAADASAIWRPNHEEDMLEVQIARDLAYDLSRRGIRVPRGRGWVSKAIDSRAPVQLVNITRVLAESPDFLPRENRIMMEELSKTYQAMLIVPLVVKDSEAVSGAISFYFRQPRRFSDEEIGLAVTLGDQVALAVENARLRAEVEQTAVAAERVRLARELHDAVTQTLFSVSLTAEVLPRLWERNPDHVWPRLEKLRLLTRGALAEMRTLLVELRPGALTSARLPDLIRQLVEAFSGRTQIRVDLALEGQRYLPPDVQIGFYRIAQEALNNIAKHAQASSVVVQLNLLTNEVQMLIRDNGCGFTRETVTADHMGLSIMQERADATGISLTIESHVGSGTSVSVIWLDQAVEREGPYD